MYSRMYNPFEKILNTPEEIAIYDDIQKTPAIISTGTFASEHEFTWVSGMLIDKEQIEYIKESNFYVTKNPSDVSTTIINDINKYQTSLALLKMGKYGYGVIATNDIPADVHIAEYAAQLWHYEYIGTVQTDKDRSLAILDENKQIAGVLDASKFRGIASFCQHAPSTLNQYCIVNMNYQGKIATQNVSLHYSMIDGYLLATLKTLRPISKGNLVFFDYEKHYFECKNHIPSLFTTYGALVPQIAYKALNFTLIIHTEKGKEQRYEDMHDKELANKGSLPTKVQKIVKDIAKYRKLYAHSPFLTFKSVQSSEPTSKGVELQFVRPSL